MIRTRDPRQLILPGFDWPFHTALDKNNRWVKLSGCIPWDDLAEAYHGSLSSTHGRPAKDARLVIGAVIIKHKQGVSDRETVAQIQENPYLQYFVGLPGYQMQAPFAPSLLVEIRKRMGANVFDAFCDAVIQAVDRAKSKRSKPTANQDQSTDSPSPPSSEQQHSDPATETAQQSSDEVPKGKLIVDATVAPQAIRFPTDLGLLNEARQCSEAIIDQLYPTTELTQKPRTYRQKARRDYLSVVKQKRPGAKRLRRGIKQQLQYLRRNLQHIENLLNHLPANGPLPLSNRLLHRYWVIQQVLTQQWEMFCSGQRRCDDRIVSISQPYVRPIVRGKADKPVEFGAKLNVSLTGDGIARVDHLRWDAFHEGCDLPAQVEAYRQRYGHYPEVVIGDTLYGSRDNRRYLKQRGIRFAGKLLGRPRKITETNRDELKQLKAQRKQEYRQRIPIEGKFGQGKSGYGLSYIRAKRADTSAAWINSIFMVMNLLTLLKVFCALIKRAWIRAIEVLYKRVWKLATIYAYFVQSSFLSRL